MIACSQAGCMLLSCRNMCCFFLTGFTCRCDRALSASGSCDSCGIKLGGSGGRAGTSKCGETGLCESAAFGAGCIGPYF